MPLPIRYTVWCMSGSVSSSRTGSAPSSASYHGMLTARSRTVRATWVIGGKVSIGMFSSVGRVT